MARTTPMRLVELMVYKEDIHGVLKYLGEKGQFQFQEDLDGASGDGTPNTSAEIFNRLEHTRAALSIPDLDGYSGELDIPTKEDEDNAASMISMVDDLHQKEVDASEEFSKVSAALDEARAFSNLNVSYSELETLSFLTMRIGKIIPGSLDGLKASIGSRATVVQLGDDPSRVLVACSKKARFAVDSELKKVDFVEIQIPKDFKGIPEDAMKTLEKRKDDAARNLEEIQTERKNFAETHSKELLHLLQVYSVDSQICEVQSKLESTEFVYRINGWIPAYSSKEIFNSLDALTEGRIGYREYLPEEVSSVASGQEKVPVQLKHGKIVRSFERTVLSYGAPLYGTVDPTPFVAIFFTLLFGIMFGDAGQGLVFVIVGILMVCKKIKLLGWEKFGIVFMCIGVSSMIMGLLTGEFFANEEILAPFSRWVTGHFGTPRDQILPMMPGGDSESIKRMFIFFGFTIAVGFVINSVGIIINIVNQFVLRKPGKAIFGKTGISGAVFFWYVIFFALKVALFNGQPMIYDWIIIGLSLLMTSFGEPFARLMDGERPVLENGFGSALISGVVEIIEVISSYLSNTVSFVRVGAFALAHAVLGYLIEKMVSMAPGVGGILISIVGNAIVVALEGMIVAIQVVRLQYYEFFSKFFHETGRDFKPFAFTYKSVEG
ncbi:MAG: ATPase [Treponema sp.]|nr:ATPase [Treponema sp.]